MSLKLTSVACFGISPTFWALSSIFVQSYSMLRLTQSLNQPRPRWYSYLPWTRYEIIIRQTQIERHSMTPPFWRQRLTEEQFHSKETKEAGKWLRHKCFSHMCEDLSSIPGTRVKMLGVVAHARNPSDSKTGLETGGSLKFPADLDYLEDV